MIMLADHTFKIVKRCRHENEFCDYICYLKNQANKRADSDPENLAAKWGFTCYPHKFLEDFFKIQDEKAFREAAEQACRQQQKLLVIHKGERASPLIVPVTSEQAFAQLRKDWCKSYARDHGLIVITE